MPRHSSSRHRRRGSYSSSSASTDSEEELRRSKVQVFARKSELDLRDRTRTLVIKHTPHEKSLVFTHSVANGYNGTYAPPAETLVELCTVVLPIPLDLGGDVVERLMSHYQGLVGDLWAQALKGEHIRMDGGGGFEVSQLLMDKAWKQKVIKWEKVVPGPAALSWTERHSEMGRPYYPFQRNVNSSMSWSQAIAAAVSQLVTAGLLSSRKKHRHHRRADTTNASGPRPFALPAPPASSPPRALTASDARRMHDNIKYWRIMVKAMNREFSACLNGTPPGYVVAALRATNGNKADHPPIFSYQAHVNYTAWAAEWGQYITAEDRIVNADEIEPDDEASAR